MEIEAMTTAPTLVRVQFDNDEPFESTLAAFIDQNADDLDTIDAVIQSADEKRPIAVGGGAGPLVTILVLS
jgi:hypothetical protein